MRIHVNGEARITTAEASVAELLEELNLRGDRVAVELNLEILDRKEFGTRKLQEGDRVEILSFIGGGEECGQRRALWTFSDRATRGRRESCRLDGCGMGG